MSITFQTVCYICGKPAVAFINTAATIASSVPSTFKTVCDEHNLHSFIRHAWKDIEETFFRELRALTPEQYDAYMADLRRWYDEDAVRPRIPGK